MKIKRVVFLSPPTSTYRYPEENLGLEYLVAESRKNGHKVLFVDAWLQSLKISDVIKKILKFKPDVLGISVSMDSVKQSLIISQKIKKSNPNITIVVGGIYSSFNQKKSKNIDLVIKGEGDIAFQKLLEGKTTVDCLSTTINLDNLPFPDRSHLKYSLSYRSPSHIMGSKGCYGNCSFCSISSFYKHYSNHSWIGRSPDSILKEIKQLYLKGETMFKFIDDNFFGPKDHQRERKLAQKIIQSGIKIKFRISLRVNDVKEESISLLKKAGLVAVSLGVESFVQRKLNLFNKGTKIEDGLKALKILKKYNIYVQMGFIMFDPEISIDEIKQEIKYLSKNSWPIYKGIWTELFLNKGTPLADKYKNLSVKIKNKKANNFYQLIMLWAKSQRVLYDKTIDPISAPRNINQKYYKKFHQQFLRLRKMDMEIAKKIIRREISSKQQINQYVRNHQSIIDDISKKVDKLYNILKIKFI